MAKMFPKIDPAKIENLGERKAYNALSVELPADWFVRWHYPYCVWENGRLREGQADFIAIAPSKGILVIEVKSTKECEIDKDGQWSRVRKGGADEPLKESPLEQAAKNMHRIVKELCSKVYRADRFPGTYGHFAFYPEGKIIGEVPLSDEPAIVLEFKDIGNLASRLNGVLRDWGSDSGGQHFSDSMMKLAVDTFSKSLDVVPVLAACKNEDEQAITELTRLQFGAFKGLLGNPRVHVKGVAGSGKTLLARWTCEHFSGEGSRVLMTCYNSVLAEWLRKIDQKDTAFEIQSFFKLCRKIVLKAGIPFNVPSDKDGAHEFWNADAPNLLCNALEQLSEEDFKRYDAIVVDEGQDFHPLWWLPLQLLLKDPDEGRLCIFSDSDQAGLYAREDSYPSPIIPYELRENCRNTRRIASYCGGVIGREAVTSMFQPEGVNPIVEKPSGDPKARARRVKSVYAELLSEGFKSSEIAILSPFSKKNSACAFNYLTNISNLPLKGGEDFLGEWHDGNIAWASTVKQFKGLEAACIILVDAVITRGDQQEVAESYVGATRAKHHLVVIPRAGIA